MRHKPYNHEAFHLTEATDIDDVIVKHKFSELLKKANSFKNQSERIELLEKNMSKREMAYMLNELVKLTNALDSAINESKGT